MKQKLSKTLLISFILGVAYMLYSLTYWGEELHPVQLTQQNKLELE